MAHNVSNVAAEHCASSSFQAAYLIHVAVEDTRRALGWQQLLSNHLCGVLQRANGVVEPGCGTVELAVK